MPSQRAVPRIAVEDDDAFDGFLLQTPRALVAFCGEGCSYSTHFEPEFVRLAADSEWVAAVRRVEKGGEGPFGRRLGIEVTPTVIAYRGGHPVALLEGEVGRGIDADEFVAWIAALD